MYIGARVCVCVEGGVGGGANLRYSFRSPYMGIDF